MTCTGHRKDTACLVRSPFTTSNQAMDWAILWSRSTYEEIVT